MDMIGEQPYLNPARKTDSRLSFNVRFSIKHLSVYYIPQLFERIPSNLAVQQFTWKKSLQNVSGDSEEALQEGAIRR
jgi:hypothetical protein